jgi:hypothetical protein
LRLGLLHGLVGLRLALSGCLWRRRYRLDWGAVYDGGHLGRGCRGLSCFGRRSLLSRFGGGHGLGCFRYGRRGRRGCFGGLSRCCGRSRAGGRRHGSSGTLGGGFLLGLFLGLFLGLALGLLLRLALGACPTRCS